MPGALVAVGPMEHSLSWAEIDWMIECSVAAMRGRRFMPSRIIPVGGGGIIPAAIMAYRFYKKDNIPINLLPPVYAKSYDPDNQQHRLEVLWPMDIENYDSSATLFVDDIVDTGVTLNTIRNRMPKSHFFSLVTKIEGQPHWYATLDRENRWWNFPWEKVAQKTE